MDVAAMMTGEKTRDSGGSSWSLFQQSSAKETGQSRKETYLEPSTVELNAVVSLKEGQAANRAAL